MMSGDIDRDAPLTPWERVCVGILILFVGACFAFFCGGCAYRGGKVIDGTNLAVGMTIPGTEWTINALDYVGGIRVAGNDMTAISVTNEVAETNEYFGVVRTSRRTKMTARIEPCETAPQADAGKDKEDARQ